MERKFLEDLGISKEIIDKVMAENGKDIEAQKALTAAEAGKLTAANDTIKQLQEAVKKFDGVDIEKLKKDVGDWENKYNTDISKLKLETALDMALVGNKARNSKAVKALLNLDEIKLDGDKLIGLDSQLEKLKTESDYLFEGIEKATTSDTTNVSTGMEHGDSLDGESDKFISAAMKGAGLQTETK